MTGLYVLLAVAGIVGDIVALYFAFHSRRHERENTELLRGIQISQSEIYRSQVNGFTSLSSQREGTLKKGTAPKKRAVGSGKT